MILTMPVSEILLSHEYLVKNDNAGVRLEGWTNVRNTKNRYHNQLRNFTKVCMHIITLCLHTDQKIQA